MAGASEGLEKLCTMARDVDACSKLGLLAGSSDVVHLRPSVSSHAAFTCV